MTYIIVMMCIAVAWLAIEAFCAFALLRNERRRQSDQHEHVPGERQ